MKPVSIKLILGLIVFWFGQTAFSQPGESDKKYNIHEIKLYEREDGTKAGAIAWFTASPDSIQKFVIRGLSIMEPVQVLLQALSPNDEVTLQFIKEKWSEPESSISAKGKKIGKKIFRTYKTAAMKISAKKAGIPYLILVQIGKKLPVKNAPLFKITNDKNEYNEYLKNKGNTSKNRADEDIAVIPLANNVNGGGDSSSNSSLLYIIIGLLALMVVLLGYFIFVKKGSKKILMIIFLLGLGINSSWSQEGGPIQIPPENTEQTSYTNADVGVMINSTLIASIFELLSNQANLLSDIDVRYEHLSEQLNLLENTVSEGLAELSETDSYLDGAYLDLRNEFQAFKNEFGDNMPGEDTEGGNRIIPPGNSEAELNRLRNRIRRLEAKVEFLSDRDRNYAPDEDDEEMEWVISCEDLEACNNCNNIFVIRSADLKEKFRELNRILVHNDWVTETGIATGNNLANSAPGMGLGWQKQLILTQQARRKLWRTYHAKYAELKGRAESLVNEYISCMDNAGAEYDTWDDEYRERANENIKNNFPEMVTPLF